MQSAKSKNINSVDAKPQSLNKLDPDPSIAVVTAQPNRPLLAKFDNLILPPGIHQTVKRIEAGDRQQIQVLRRQLAQVPHVAERLGDIVSFAISGFANRLAKDNVLVRESIVVASELEREALSADASSSMEKDAIDFMVVAKLQAECMDVFAASVPQADLGVNSRAETIMKHQQSARHQFRESVNHLAKIRFLEKAASPVQPAIAASQPLRLYSPPATPATPATPAAESVTTNRKSA